MSGFLRLPIYRNRRKGIALMPKQGISSAGQVAI